MVINQQYNQLLKRTIPAATLHGDWSMAGIINEASSIGSEPIGVVIEHCLSGLVRRWYLPKHTHLASIHWLSDSAYCRSHCCSSRRSSKHFHVTCPSPHCDASLAGFDFGDSVSTNRSAAWYDDMVQRKIGDRGGGRIQFHRSELAAGDHGKHTNGCIGAHAQDWAYRLGGKPSIWSDVSPCGASFPSLPRPSEPRNLERVEIRMGDVSECRGSDVEQRRRRSDAIPIGADVWTGWDVS